MTLFSADPLVPSDPVLSERRTPRRRSVTVGWVMLAVGLVGALVLGFLPTPYVIERPGPVFDTLGDVQISGEEQPLIDIADEETFPTEGTLDLLTVNIVGSPDDPPNWVEVALAWFDSSKAVVPIENVFPAGITREESSEQSALDMTNSQQEAIAAALRQQGYDVPGVVVVAGLVDGSPAVGAVEEGDEILVVNGTAVQDVTELRELIAENGTDAPLEMTIRRDGAEQDVEVTPAISPDDGATPIIGIFTGARYEYPFEVTIQLENVGGPSAGMMFALGIIDKLTPGAMTGGESIAGTGTITADGAVGGIGGIRQKMYGALDAGASWFLAPASNCGEVVGNIPDGLTVYSVETLDDALAAVEAVGTGEGRDALATCEAP
ncbi:MAG: PDZ domain-containing protein [Microbacteriaceae bacterium]